MTTQQASRTFTMEPYMWFVDHAGQRAEADPPFRYYVYNEHRERVGFITNKRASSHPPSWQISHSEVEGSIGDYATAEEALSNFQELHSSSLSLTEGSDFTVSFWCIGKWVAYQFFHLSETVGDRISISRDQAIQYGWEAAETGTSELFPIAGIDIEAVRNFGRRLWQYGKNGE